MKISYPMLLVLFLSCCWLMACQSSKPSANNKSSGKQMTEEALLAKTTLERLILMQEGTFLLFDSTTTRPLIMKSGDSLILYSRQFGDVNKNGYWLYQKMYMTSLPDAPLSIDFLKISKLSRDSFSVEQFTAGEEFKAADKNPGVLKSVNFDELESIECNIIFEKKGQLEFKGETPICTINFDGGASQTFSNSFHITAKGTRLVTTYYKKEGEENVFSSQGHCYLKR